jgi:hypothetical protein
MKAILLLQFLEASLLKIKNKLSLVYCPIELEILERC